MKTKVWQRSIGAWLFLPILLAASTLAAGDIWWFTSFILYITIALTVSVGYHRLFCHNAFECSEFWHWFFGIVGCVSLNTSPLQWSAVHIQHHKLSDTDEDPYDSNFNHYLRFKERTDIPPTKNEVRLLRKKERKGYELFVMGLHGTTVKNISLEDISNYTRFVTKIAEVLKTASDWWDGKSN